MIYCITNFFQHWSCVATFFLSSHKRTVCISLATLSSMSCVLIEADRLRGCQCPAACTYYKNGSAHADEEQRFTTKGTPPRQSTLCQDGKHHYGITGLWRKDVKRKRKDEGARKEGATITTDHEDEYSRQAELSGFPCVRFHSAPVSGLSTGGCAHRIRLSFQPQS